jgi:hypothetical protein
VRFELALAVLVEGASITFPGSVLAFRAEGLGNEKLGTGSERFSVLTEGGAAAALVTCCGFGTPGREAEVLPPERSVTPSGTLA